MNSRILVVDDNPTNLKLAVSLLEFEGHLVSQARNAEEALRMIQESMPTLILMDIQMPGLDGLSLTRQLRQNPATRDICIVAITSFAMKGDDQKARESGCDGYITKPIDTRTFPAQVAQFLHGRPSQPQSPSL